MPYGEILTQAARLVWKFKILWLFGLLASCSSGASRFNTNFNFNPADLAGANGFQSEQMQPLIGILNRLETMMTQTPWSFFGALAALICGLSLFTWLIGIFGRTGLALGAWQGDAGAENLQLDELNQGSVDTYWRVAGVSLLVGLPGLTVGLIFVLITGFSLFSMIADQAPAASAVLLCLTLPFICLMLPLFWELGILSELVTVAVIGEGHGVMAGIKRGWGLFRRHLGPLQLVGLLVLLLQIIAGVVAGLILAPLAIGALAMGVFLNQPPQTNLALLAGLLLILGPISLLFSAVFNAYTGTLWVLVFRRLAAAEPPAAPLSFPPPLQPVYPAPAAFPNPPFRLMLI